MSGTKRAAIHRAALSLFAEKGVQATTTREIARRAGTAEGNIYRHFESKDDLARILFEEGAGAFYQVLAESARGVDDPRERLRAMVGGIFDFARRHPESFAYLLSVQHTPIPYGGEEGPRPRPMRLFIETLAAGMERGVFRRMDPALATTWIVAMAQRTVVALGAGIVTVSAAEAVSLTAEAALRLMAADAEPA